MMMEASSSQSESQSDQDILDRHLLQTPSSRGAAPKPHHEHSAHEHESYSPIAYLTMPDGQPLVLTQESIREAEPGTPLSYQLKSLEEDEITISQSAKIARLQGLRPGVPLELIAVDAETLFDFIDNQHGPDIVAIDVDDDRRFTKRDRYFPVQRFMHALTPGRTVIVPKLYDDETSTTALSLIQGTGEDCLLVVKEHDIDAESVLRPRMRQIIQQAVEADTGARREGRMDEYAHLEDQIYGPLAIGRLIKPELPDLLGSMSLKELQELSADLLPHYLRSELVRESESALDLEDNPYLTGELFGDRFLARHAEEIGEWCQDLKAEVGEDITEAQARLAAKWDAIMPDVKVTPRFGTTYYTGYLLHLALKAHASGQPVNPISAGVLGVGAGIHLGIAGYKLRKALREEREQKEIEERQQAARARMAE